MSDEQKTASELAAEWHELDDCHHGWLLEWIKRIQNSTLERAAKVAEQGLTTFSPLEIARAIRALKEPS